MRQALDELGIDEVSANELGLRALQGRHDLAARAAGHRASSPQGLDLILVIEEKRSLIETQVKEQLYDLPDRPRVLGKKDENEQLAVPGQVRARPERHRHKIGERLMQRRRDEDCAPASPSWSD